MFIKAFIVAAAVASVQARFGEEHPAVIQQIASLQAGAPGVAATLAGGSISNLLAASNPCDKLTTADKMIAALGNGSDVLTLVRTFVAAEQNFNPFATDRPTFCSDPTLPATAELRGVIPLVDPAVAGAAAENTASAASITTPLNAAGLSVAQVIANSGFTTFNTKDAAGTAGSTGAQLAGGAAAAAPANGAAAATTAAAAAATTAAAAAATDAACPAPVTVTVTAAAAKRTLPTRRNIAGVKRRSARIL